jgi:hypothetical protein
MTEDYVPGAAENRRLTKRLPSARLGFQKQMEILRAFALLSSGGTAPVHYTKVAQTVQAHESNVSTMNPFFVENGFLVKSGNGQIPAGPVLEFARKYSWNRETAGHALQPIISATWFAEALLNRLHFRPLSEDEAIEVLAAACSAGPDVKPQLRMLIDYLDTAGLVRRENGQLQPIVDHRPPDPQAPEPEPPVAEAARRPPAAPQPVQASAASSPGKISLNVNVSVDMAELSTWSADRITAFFAGVAKVLAAQNNTAVKENVSEGVG